MASQRSFLSRAYSAARKAGLSDVAARVAATQAAHETNFGKSAPGNNFFGIKAGKSWKGKTQRLSTWESVNGVKKTIKDTFRKYDSFEESFKDWAKNIAKNWPGVLSAATFEEAVAALGAGLPGGYATDPKYDVKLAAMNNRLDDALAFNLPDEMTPPQTLAQVQAQERVAQAYRDPFRALDVVPSSQLASLPSRPLTTNPPSRFAPVPSGTITRNALPSIPASLTPAPVGRVERAPLGPVGQFTAPAQSLAHPVSAPKPTNLAAAPVSPVTKGPALAPAGPSTAAQAAAYGQYAQSRMAAEQQAQTAKLAEQYGQYRPGTVPQPATPLAHPVSVPSLPPAPAIAAPAPVLAPALAPPKTVQDSPIADIAATPPAPRASDVYSGLATEAFDNTGRNKVSNLPGGATAVTNQYGVTTATMPDGKQAAVGSMPSLPGISGPMASKIGGALPGVAGSMLGGYFGGPVGAIAGGLLAKAITGGLLGGNIGVGKSIGDGLVSYAAPGLGGSIVAAAPQRGGGFPSAPGGGYGSGGRMGASYSNRSRADMDSISPGASKAIGAGKGGLY